MNLQKRQARARRKAKLQRLKKIGAAQDYSLAELMKIREERLEKKRQRQELHKKRIQGLGSPF